MGDSINGLGVSYLILFIMSKTKFSIMIGSPRTFLSCNRHHVCIQLHSLREVSLLLEKASKRSKRTGVTVSAACTNARFNSGLALPLARHAHSHTRTLSCFTFFPTDFLEKERLLAITGFQFFCD